MAPTLLVPGSLRAAPAEVPVRAITEWLKRRMPEYGGPLPTRLRDRVIIAKSETGSGKSTVLPAFVFRLLRSEGTPPRQRYAGRSVLCTQPRVMTATTLAADMAASPNYPDLVLPGAPAPGGPSAGTVGYQTGPLTNKPARGLVYSTAGVLLAQLQAAAVRGDFSPVSDAYAFIIVDEAHERSLDIDRVLMLLKQFLLSGLALGGNAARRLPFVVLASATIDERAYARFFDLLEEAGPLAGLPRADNFFHVVGRQHPIETRWPATGTNDYMASAVAAAAAIHLESAADPPDQRDVLVFMPGGVESKAVAAALEQRRDAGALDAGGPVVVLTINREAVNTRSPQFRLVKAPGESLWGVLERNELYPAARLAEMRAAGLHPRRIIVSTVVAETGLTVETLKYVIDAGWNRTQEVYQPHGAGGLITRPAAQSRIQQRKGRAGRLFPGVFYPLYTESSFRALAEQQMPDIVVEDAGPLLLTMVLSQQIEAQRGGRARAFRLERLDMLDPPPVDALAAALDQAFALGFMSARVRAEGGGAAGGAAVGYGLTGLGSLAVLFPRLPLPLVRLLLGAPLWGAAVSDLATVVAVAQVCGERGLAQLLGRAERRLAARGGPAAVAAALAPALAEGLPEAFTAARGGVPVPAAQACAEARAVMQDDLLEGLCVFEAFRRRLSAAVAADPDHFYAAVAAWCERAGLDAGAMHSLAAAREAALEEMVAAGLNPFWGDELRLARAADADVLARVRALKRCALDAFRLNLLLPGAGGRRGYVSAFGLPVAGGGGAFPAAVSPQVVVVPVPGGRELRWELAAPLLCVLETGMAETRVAPAADLVLPAAPPAAGRGAREIPGEV